MLWLCWAALAQHWTISPRFHKSQEAGGGQEARRRCNQTRLTERITQYHTDIKFGSKNGGWRPQRRKTGDIHYKGSCHLKLLLQWSPASQKMTELHLLMGSQEHFLSFWIHAWPWCVFFFFKITYVLSYFYIKHSSFHPIRFLPLSQSCWGGAMRACVVLSCLPALNHNINI